MYGKVFLWVSILLAAVTLQGCKGSSNNPTQPTPVRSVIAQGNFSVLDIAASIVAGDVCGFIAFVTFTTPATGTLDVSVDWRRPSNDLDIAIASGTCNCRGAVNNTCQEVASSDSATAKPERLTVNGLAGGSYTLLVANFGAKSDSGTYEIGLLR